MATQKDLVEAHAFSRRRLVTAFLSGAPGGREVEPARPGRTVVGGLALAVLLVAAAAIASVLTGTTEEDWNKVGLVVSREQAAPYVLLENRDHRLLPVLNITSAQLILGVDVEPTYVEQEVIEQQTPGETIGILGAPPSLPRPSRFVDDGWTACTADEHGVMLGLRSGADVEPRAGGGMVVSHQGRDYVVARSGELTDHPRATLYPLPDDPNVDAMLNELGLRERAEALEVPEDWLQLFPAGGELGWSSFGILGPGTSPTVDAASYPPGARIGDYWVDGDEGLVITDQGLMRLSPFALRVYRYSLVPRKDPTRPGRLPDQLDGSPPATEQALRTYTGAVWPDSTLDQLTGDPCALLVTGPGDLPGVELVEDPGDTIAAADLGPLVVDYAIEAGRGAFVATGDWDGTTSGTSYVVDPSGTAYPLADAETIERLGYDEVAVPLVPEAWVALFERGVELSTDAALCAPSRSGAADRPCEDPPG